ncbi:hypothetical protein Tco_0698526 [Tanacetum coccineum]
MHMTHDPCELAIITEFLELQTPYGYALTVNPTIYVSYIEQFWSTAKAQTINEETHIHALVDGKKIVITESSVRRDLQFAYEDAEHVSGNITKTRSKATLNEPTPQGTGSSSGPRRQDTKGDTITQTRFENVSKTFYDLPLGGVNTPRSDEDSMKLKELMEMCTNLLQRVQDLETTKTTQAKEITSLKKKVKKLEQRGRSRTPGLKRLYKVGTSRRVESSTEASLGDQEDASKQGRNIAKIDADVDILLVHEDVGIQGRFDDEHIFVTSVFNDEDVFAGQDMADQEVNVAEKEVSVTDPVTTAGEVVTTASVDISTASVLITVSTATPTTTPTTTIEDDMTLAETLMEIKSAKLKAIGVVMQEPSEIPRISAAQQQIQEKAQGSRDKAEMEKEDRLARQREEEDNIVSWDNAQAMMEADYQMAERLHAEEQASLTDEEKASLFVQLLDARKKHFAALRAQEIRNKPPTKMQKRTTMCNYLKNMAGYKHNQLRHKSFDDIQKLFDKALKRVNTFVPMDTEKVEGSKAKAAGSETRVEESSKRAGEELDRESTKKQKVYQETILRGEEMFGDFVKKYRRDIDGGQSVKFYRKLFQKAHLYVIQNTDEIVPYIERQRRFCKLEKPGNRFAFSGEMSTVNPFAKCLRKEIINLLRSVSNLPKESVSETVRWISYGPRTTVVKYDAYDINGYTFRMKCHDGKVYQNSGSWVRDTKDIRIASNPFLRPYPHTILYHITNFDLAVNISQSFNWEDFLKTSEEIDYDSSEPPKSFLKWYHYLSDEYRNNAQASEASSKTKVEACGSKVQVEACGSKAKLQASTKTLIVKSPVPITNCILGLANAKTWDAIKGKTFGVQIPLTMTFPEVKIGKRNLKNGNSEDRKGASKATAPIFYGPSIQGLLDAYGYNIIEEYLSWNYFPSTDNESTDMETTNKRNTNKDYIVDSNSAMSNGKYVPVYKKHKPNMYSHVPVIGSVLGLPNVTTWDEIKKKMGARKSKTYKDKAKEMNGRHVEEIMLLN